MSLTQSFLDDVIDVTGEALVTFGLSVRTTVGIDGFSLATRGLYWNQNNVWLDTESLNPITTTWASGEASITTVWTEV